MTVETFAVFDMQTSEKDWLSENDYISTSLIVLLFPILIYKIVAKTYYNSSWGLFPIMQILISSPKPMWNLSQGLPILVCDCLNEAQ